jgi:hypothetical protein
MAFWPKPKQSLLVWIESIYKFLEFGPLLTKVRHNLAHLELQEKALISIQRLLLPLLSSLRTFPIALNFTTRLLLQHLVSFRAFSYSTYCHYWNTISFHLKAQNISLTSSAPSSVGAW